MTDLKINRESVDLPADFSFRFKRTNRFMSNENDHSYDITLSMKTERNSRIFRHVNRFHVKRQLDGYYAKLYLDNKLILEGNVFLLEMDEDSIKIQIVAVGMSYSYKKEDSKTEDEGKLKIKKLNLGNIYEGELTENMVIDSVQGTYPHWNYACIPSATQYFIRGRITDNFTKVHNNDMIVNYISPTNIRQVYGGKQFRPHFYLLFVIDRIVNALGYRIARNDLARDEQAKRELVITDMIYQSLASHLPNWTVAKFFREIEKHYNCLCVFNKITHLVDIMQMKTIVRTVTIPQDRIIDNIRIKIGEDKLERVINNYSYQFPGEPKEFRDYDIDPQIMENTPKVYVPSVNMTADNSSQIISKCEGFDMIRRRYDAPMKDGQNYYEKITALNIYQHKGDGSNKLDIVPCLYEVCQTTTYQLEAGELKEKYLFKVPIPVCTNKKNNEAFIAQSVQDMIDDGIKEVDNTADQMFIAVYNRIVDQPFKSAFAASNTYQYPEISVPVMIDTENDLYDRPNVKTMYKREQVFSLQLSEVQKRYYNIDINEKYCYHIKFLTDRILDADIFFIDNKKLFCSQIEYSIDADGLKPIAEGDFYEIKG